MDHILDAIRSALRAKGDVSIRAFGAVGDGVADDTDALLAAAKAGGAVFFPAGTYLLSKQINLSADICWYGAGRSSTVIRLLPLDQSRPEEYDGRTVYNSYILSAPKDSAVGIELRDLTLDANKTAFKDDSYGNGSSKYDHTVCVDLYQPKYFIAQNIRCTGALIEGCYLFAEGSDYVNISGCLFDDNGYSREDASGLHIEGTQNATVISNCAFRNNGFHGLLLAATGASVSNVSCVGNGYSGVCLWGGASRNTLSAVYCEGNQSGLHIKAAYSPFGVDVYEDWMNYAAANTVSGLATVENTYGIMFGNCEATIIDGWNCISDDYAYHIGYSDNADKPITGKVKNHNLTYKVGLFAVSSASSELFQITFDGEAGEAGPVTPELPPAKTVTVSMESGKLVQSSGEAAADDASIRSADFIEVSPGCRLSFRASNKMNACFICYNKAREYIAGWNDTYGYAWLDSGDAIGLPEEAAYVKFFCESTDLAATYTISLYALESAPEYVGAEAARVAGVVQAHRSANSFTFACTSDLHYGVEDQETTYAILHTAQGLERLHNLLALDLAAFLGDYVSGDTDDTVEIIKDGLTFARKTFLPALRGIPALWCDGNHDKNYYSAVDMTPDEMYAYLGANNKGAVTDYGNRQRNYGYRDFPEAKLRCIYLNTSDTSDMATADTSVYATAAQAGWLARTALDLSDKQDAEAWGIVLFSHIPLSWSASKLGCFTDILDAYTNGASGSATAADGVKVEYDFSAAVRGEIICALHGHVHNFAAETVGASQIRSIACPQVCVGRYNHYAADKSPFAEYDADGNPIYHYKTPGTAKDTSFLVVVINRNTKRIYAAAFGEGIDREFSYALPLPDIADASVTQEVALTIGKGVSSSTGEVRDETGSSVTADMIRVAYGAAVTITNTLSAKAKVICYNAYGNFIKGWNGGYSHKYVSSGGSVTLPKSAAYIRFSIEAPEGTTEVSATVTSVKPQ